MDHSRFQASRMIHGKPSHSIRPEIKLLQKLNSEGGFFADFPLIRCCCFTRRSLKIYLHCGKTILTTVFIQKHIFLNQGLAMDPRNNIFFI